jgi:hypothetical protein
LILFKDIQKRNYELEQAKYLLTGKKVRENPLLDGINGGRGGDEGSAPMIGGGGFGSQQNFQLGKADFK